MTEKETLGQVADALTDQPDIITVSIKPAHHLQALCQRVGKKYTLSYGWFATERSYELRRLVVGNAYRISKAVLDIPEASVVLGSEHTQGQLYSLLVNHLDKVVYVVAVGLTNSRKEPSKSFLEEIRWQFTDTELLTTCLLILKQVNIQNFLHSIILIRGLDVLTNKMSPADTGGIIAPGESLAG